MNTWDSASERMDGISREVAPEYPGGLFPLRNGERHQQLSFSCRVEMVAFIQHLSDLPYATDSKGGC